MNWYLVTIEFTIGKASKSLKETYEYYIPASNSQEAKDHLEQLLTGAPACVLSSNTIWPLKFGASFKIKKAILVKG